MNQHVLITDDNRAQVFQVLHVMEEVVREFGPGHRYQRRGHTTYSKCYYLNEAGDGPDCLIGQVLWRFGVSAEELGDIEHMSIPLTVYGDVDSSLPDAFRGFCLDSRKVMDAAQGAQDIGDAWDQALTEARANARALGYDT